MPRRLTLAFIAGILAALPLLAAAGPATRPATLPTTRPAPVPLRIGHIIFDGGDGSSMESAVIIRNAANESEGVAAESQWMRKVHPGWVKGTQGLFQKNGRHYDRIDYTNRGEKLTIYFDITDFFGKF